MPELVVQVQKYTVLLLPGGELKALRNNKKWRDVTGDNLVLLMAMEIDRLRTELKIAQEALDNWVYGGER